MNPLISQLREQGISNEDILQAIGKVRREEFVREDLKSLAYEDEALPIDCGQTISQPFVVARMTELLLSYGPVKKVLEIGTGSGYQAAVLAELVEEVYTIERIKKLYLQAQLRFKKLHYKNVHCFYGDGYLGWPEHAPYDGIIITAAATEVPTHLQEQLADNACMVVPIGVQFSTQELITVVRRGDRFEYHRHDYVVFVPMLHGKSED